jgi:hypothetical protein
MGFRKSSRRISPGWIGGIVLLAVAIIISPYVLSVIIYNLNLIGILILPSKADPPLIIYANAPFTYPVTG